MTVSRGGQLCRLIQRRSPLNFPDTTVDALKEIANNRGTTVTEALRQVIESQRFLQTETEQGNKLLIQNPADRAFDK